MDWNVVSVHSNVMVVTEQLTKNVRLASRSSHIGKGDALVLVL